MTEENRFKRFYELEAVLGIRFDSIRTAINCSEAKAKFISQLLVPNDARPIAEDVGVVFFGSLARGEWTSKSDADWIVLIDGQVDEQHFRAYHNVRKTLLDNKVIPPGSSGTFGGLAFSHDIVHYIGGHDDTNRNLTLRMLLLLESVSIGDDAVRKRVIRAILRRYLADDPSWTFKSNGRIPRFLLNDSVRFWRTMAVDFADKYRDQVGEKWALRNTKLRFSRKLIFLSALLACFSWNRYQERPESKPGGNIDLAQQHFIEYMSRPPLEVVADELVLNNVPRQVCKDIFSSYNEFLSILNDEELRTSLENLPRNIAEKSDLFQRVRGLSNQFQSGLIDWLFNPENPTFQLVREYGLF